MEESLERALLYEREREAATMLQQSLLPASLPVVEGLHLAARYSAGSEGTQVGGDWYDVIEVEGGRLALIVGDVMGKGIAAAAQMGRLRTALAAFISVDPDPTTVIRRLEASSTPVPDKIVTFSYLLLDPVTGRIDVAHCKLYLHRRAAAGLPYASRRNAAGIRAAAVICYRSFAIQRDLSAA